MQVEDQRYLGDSVTRDLYERVRNALDPTTASAVSSLLAHARALHHELDVEHLRPGVQVVMPISPTQAMTTGELIGSLANLVACLPAIRDGISVVVLPGSRYRVEFRSIDQDPLDGYVKYIIKPFEVELVVVAEHVFEVEPLSDRVSPFAYPYFRDLDTALHDYYVQKARKTLCPYLEQAWVDPSRLVLANKPEKHMRRSLHDYLRTRLRDADPVVLQEQNVNESEPVDIRVQWLDSHRISIIEVKWVGDSIGDDGLTISTKYRDARARDGYVQTAAYIEAQRLTLVGQIVRGYLVVFDARRRSVSRDSSGSFFSPDPWSYETRDIDYTSVLRIDSGVEDPVRYFLEPATVAAA